MQKIMVSERIMLVKINIGLIQNNGKPAVAITQQWDRDSVLHSAYTVLDAKDFSTIIHNTYWKRLGYSMDFNFTAKKVEFEGPAPDSSKIKNIKVACKMILMMVT